MVNVAFSSRHMFRSITFAWDDLDSNLFMQYS